SMVSARTSPMDLWFSAPRMPQETRKHRVRSGLLAAALLLGIPRLAAAADYYVATTGNDSNPGTLDQPFATLQKGVNVALPGDTVYIRGGTYRIVTPATSSAGISMTRSGTSDTNRIRFWAYQSEVPVFDFADMVISTTSYTNGFAVSGSFLHIKGLEIA